MIAWGITSVSSKTFSNRWKKDKCGRRKIYETHCWLKWSKKRKQNDKTESMRSKPLIVLPCIDPFIIRLTTLWTSNTLMTINMWSVSSSQWSEWSNNVITWVKKVICQRDVLKALWSYLNSPLFFEAFES
jgi:hypothetical protein